MDLFLLSSNAIHHVHFIYFTCVHLPFLLTLVTTHYHEPFNLRLVTTHYYEPFNLRHQFDIAKDHAMCIWTFDHAMCIWPLSLFGDDPPHSPSEISNAFHQILKRQGPNNVPWMSTPCMVSNLGIGLQNKYLELSLFFSEESPSWIKFASPFWNPFHHPFSRCPCLLAYSYGCFLQWVFLTHDIFYFRECSPLIVYDPKNISRWSPKMCCWRCHKQRSLMNSTCLKYKTAHPCEQPLHVGMFTPQFGDKVKRPYGVCFLITTKNMQPYL